MIRIVIYAILGGILALFINIFFLHLFDSFTLILIIAIGAIVGSVLGVILNSRSNKVNDRQL